MGLTSGEGFGVNGKYDSYIPRNGLELFHAGTSCDAWKSLGCHWISELKEFRFLVWAPNADQVSLVGDFNGWNPERMERLSDGCWCIFSSEAAVGQYYKYLIQAADGAAVFKADPFAAFSQCGSETASIVWNGGTHHWHDRAFLKLREKRNFLCEPMSIYEIHPGSWLHGGCGSGYPSTADELAAYCTDMGYTHVELMPVTEYPYDESWGYQVTGYFAPTSRYGNPDDFKYFVDRLHRAGIGVIMDWVPAHFPQDEHGLFRFDGTPLFECKEERMSKHPEWGTLIFDYGDPAVQSFLISSACCFFEEYHVDGIRVDAVSSMLYLNYGRKEGEYTPNKDGGTTNLEAVDFLRKLNTAVLTRYPGAITVAEESTAFPLVTAPPECGGLGFCLKWDMGFMHDTLDYMMLDPYFRQWNHNRLTFSMMYAFSENFVLAYSHDEVVHGKRSMINKMYGDYDHQFASLRALYSYQFSHPGKKLTFMGNEFGQFIEWNWKQPLDWFLLDYPRHRQLQDYMRELNLLYRRYPALYQRDNTWEGFRWLNVDDAERSSVAFLRTGEKETVSLVCVMNFTPVQHERFTFGLPEKGVLREILNSDDRIYGGGGNGNKQKVSSRRHAFQQFPYSAEITLPALSAIFFEYYPSPKHSGDLSDES